MNWPFGTQTSKRDLKVSLGSGLEEKLLQELKPPAKEEIVIFP